MKNLLFSLVVFALFSCNTVKKTTNEKKSFENNIANLSRASVSSFDVDSTGSSRFPVSIAIAAGLIILILIGFLYLEKRFPNLKP